MFKKLAKLRGRKRTLALVVIAAFVVPYMFILMGSSESKRIPQNVILMVADGLSFDAMTLARYMRPDNPDAPEDEQTFRGTLGTLELDNYYQGRVRTAWAGGPITDSAPAATAIATGQKSNNLRIGLNYNDDPRATIMQAAMARGMSTGLVMTSEFMHATPAAFISHDIARFNYETLGRQMLANRPNVVLGSGSAQMRSHNVYRKGLPANVNPANTVVNENPDSRWYGYTFNGPIRVIHPIRGEEYGVRVMDPDGYTIDGSRGRRMVVSNTWMETVADEGYQVVRTRAQMNRVLRPTTQNAQDLRVWGDFNGGLTLLRENHRFLSFDIDRQHRPDLDEPSLAEMTRTAIDLMRSNRNGFFLVVEGSKIDWAAHTHDSVAMMSDILAFDEAFRVARDFARRCGNTIVVAVSDHATGGLTLSHPDLSFDVPGADTNDNPTFDEAPWSIFDPLRMAVTGGARSTEAAIQLFVLCPTGQGRNHDQVMRAHGIDVDHFDNAMLREGGPTFQERRVHELMQAFRRGPEGTNAGIGMQMLSSAHLQNAQRMLGAIMNQKSFIRFSVPWHAGGDVPFFMYAPSGLSYRDLLGINHSSIDNTDIALMLANAMRISLDDLTDNLFVEVYNDGKSMNGVTVELTGNNVFHSSNGGDQVLDQNNASVWTSVEFKITRGNNVVYLKSNTNFFNLNGESISLSQGVNVYIISEPQFTTTLPFVGKNVETGRLFVPRELLRAIGA